MSESDDSDYKSRNMDTVTTEVYSERPPEEVSEESNSEQSDAGSVEVDFLANFKCGVCHLAPAFEQAVQVAPVWAAGEMPGLVTWDMQPNLANLKRVMVYCNTCHRFFHGGCILGSPFVNEINQMAELMLMKIEGYPIGAFKCNNCFHNQ